MKMDNKMMKKNIHTPHHTEERMLSAIATVWPKTKVSMIQNINVR